MTALRSGLWVLRSPDISSPRSHHNQPSPENWGLGHSFQLQTIRSMCPKKISKKAKVTQNANKIKSLHLWPELLSSHIRQDAVPHYDLDLVFLVVALRVLSSIQGLVCLNPTLMFFFLSPWLRQQGQSERGGLGQFPNNLQLSGSIPVRKWFDPELARLQEVNKTYQRFRSLVFLYM